MNPGSVGCWIMLQFGTQAGQLFKIGRVIHIDVVDAETPPELGPASDYSQLKPKKRESGVKTIVKEPRPKRSQGVRRSSSSGGPVEGNALAPHTIQSEPHRGHALQHMILAATNETQDTARSSCELPKDFSALGAVSEEA